MYYYICIYTYIHTYNKYVVCLIFKPEECENAYFKMDNVLIDDRRIHVDFSQSVSKNYQWHRQGNF